MGLMVLSESSFAGLTCPTGSTLSGGTCIANPGYTHTVNGGIAPCRAGTFSATPGATGCTPASPGTYVPTQAAQQATPADVGYYVPNQAATSQTACSANTTTTTTGQIGCSSVPGYFRNIQGQIRPCSAGSYSANLGASFCTLAAPGSYVPTEAASQATAADLGYYVPSEGATSPTACPANSTTTTTGQSVCLAKPGYYGLRTFTPCSAGTYSAIPGATGCFPATPGNYVASPAATAQTPCPAGSYSAAQGSTSCTPASPGSYAYNINNKNAGGVGATGQTYCSYGKYSATAGASTCTGASQGYYVATNGATVQTQCPSGYTNIGGGNQTCGVTAPITAANGGTCSAGHFVARNDATTYTCTLCSPGTFNSSVTVSANSLQVSQFVPCGACAAPRKTNQLIGSTACQ